MIIIHNFELLQLDASRGHAVKHCTKQVTMLLNKNQTSK